MSAFSSGKDMSALGQCPMPVGVNGVASISATGSVTNSCRKTKHFEIGALPQLIRHPRHLCSRKQRARCPSDCPCSIQTVTEQHQQARSDYQRQKVCRSACLFLTRLKSADAIGRCFSRKSISQSRGRSSLILQSSTIALLFMPPAQFSRTSPRTTSLLDSAHH